MHQARYRNASADRCLQRALRSSGRVAGELIALTSMAVGLFSSLLAAFSLLP